MASSSVTTAISSWSKKQDTILWKIENAQEATELARRTKKPVASFSFDIGEIVSYAVVN